MHNKCCGKCRCFVQLLRSNALFLWNEGLIKPLKSEAIHETGLSGNVVASFFPLIIFIYVYIYIYTLSLSNDRFRKDVKPRYFLKNNDNYWWFQRNYCCIRGSFASILWGQLSMSSSVVLCWHAFSFRLSLSRRGGLQGRGGTTLKLSLGLPCWKFSP